MSPKSRGVVRAAIAAALVLPLAGCYTSVGKWTYPSGRYPTRECPRPAPAVIAVEPLIDARSDTNRSWIAWAYVPLFPLGWTHFDRPEATQPDKDTTWYRAAPCDELARSLVTELRREKMVASAEIAGDGNRDVPPTHVLRGRLLSFYDHQSRWTYGLSIYAYFLWALALPMGTSKNGFRVDLELDDAKDGHVVWTASIFDADKYVEGCYYGPEWYRFSWMWERRLREKIGELATVLGTTPAPLPKILSEELRTSPPAKMPECLGIDSQQICTAR
jgi:hypothetical protein